MDGRGRMERRGPYMAEAKVQFLPSVFVPSQGDRRPHYSGTVAPFTGVPGSTPGGGVLRKV